MKTMMMSSALVLLLAASPAFAQTPSAAVVAAVADAGRPENDKAVDALRKPAETVAFSGMKAGDKVAELAPGGGYFTRIFAKAVGPKGQVYAFFGTQYDARLKSQGQDPDRQFTDLKRIYPNLGVIHGPLVDFVTPQKVDMVWTSDNYHDLHNKQYDTDAAVINKRVYDSLKPGGIYLIVDHRAAKGAGIGVTETLHRMDEDILKREVQAAGFRLVAESQVLAQPGDDNTKRVFEQDVRGKTDQFVLKFVKPR